MKDGYYLSTYITVNEICNLYHIVNNRHDQNISLWKKENDNIYLVHYWELERQSRIKHDNMAFYNSEMAKKEINKLLSRFDLTLDDMIEVWGSPGLVEGKDYQNNDTGYSYHSLCHLFSSVLLDSDVFYNENIIALAVDLRSDYETEKWPGGPEYTGCVVKKGEISFFNIESPAPLWRLSSKENRLEEGTLMALATASKTELKEDRTNIDFKMLTANEVENMKIFDHVFGELNADSKELIDKINFMDPDFTFEENRISAGMKDIQAISIKLMSRQIEDILQKFELDPKNTYLAVSGGYGLNCPTNSYLMNKFKFKGFMGPPCMNDSGQSLGIALYSFYRNMDKVNFKLEHAFYGDSFDNEDEIIELLKEKGYVKSATSLDLNQIVDDLIEAPLVWFDGRAEIGPRALGHRSLLGDPRFTKTKDQLNLIKQRQDWRPVAPIVLEEYVNEWFEDAYPSPFMLHTFKIREEKENLTAAILHHDKSARIQTLSNRSEQEKRLYSVIDAFRMRTGVPIICNTSLNDKGEPIVNRPNEALHFALKKNINIAYINGKRVELQNHNAYKNEAKQKSEIFIKLEDSEKEKLRKQENPYDLSREDLNCAHLLDIAKDYNIKSEKDVLVMKKIINKYYKMVGKENVYLNDEWTDTY